MSNDNWRTPPEVITYLEDRFGKIAIDLCSSGDTNAVSEFHITEEENFLDDKWLYDKMVDQGSHCFINCPYSNPVPFMAQAKKWAKAGFNVSGILNHDPSVPWFRIIQSCASLIMPVIGNDQDIGRIAFLDENGTPQISNNEPQFMFYMPAFGNNGVQKTEYIDIGDIYPHGRPLKSRIEKRRRMEKLRQNVNDFVAGN